MALYVLESRRDDAGIIDAWPKGGPSPERWLSGVSLKDEVSPQLAVSLSADYAKRKALVDFQPNRLGALFVSAKARAALERVTSRGVEYFPLTLKDAKGKVLSRDYSLVNPVGLEDAIDLARSKVELVPGTTDRVARLERLAVAPRRVHPGATLFRCAALPTLLFVRDAVREVVLGARLTGASFFDADGFSPDA